MGASFEQQAECLSSAGYPKPVVVFVTERILREARPSAQQPAADDTSGEPPKVGVVLYMHGISHNLKNIAQKANVKGVFSAPNKLGKLCKLINLNGPTLEKCIKQHRNKFVECADRAVYNLLLSCGRQYVQQTGHCLNDQLHGHNNNNVNTGTGGFLMIHCQKCGCKPIFNQHTIVSHGRTQLIREITEAEMISRLGGGCVRSPSLALTGGELSCLAAAPCGS